MANMTRILRDIFVLALCSTIWNFAFAGPLVLPSEEDVKGIERLCGGGRSEVLSIKGDVNAAIKNWKSASAGAGLVAAKEQLAGFLTKIKDDSNLAPALKIYVDCVDRTLQRFMDQSNRQPVPISRTGQSPAMLRSAFASDEEMNASGCDEAEQGAKLRMQKDCGDRQLVVLAARRCSRSGDSPRTYAIEVSGECRVRD